MSFFQQVPTSRPYQSINRPPLGGHQPVRVNVPTSTNAQPAGVMQSDTKSPGKVAAKFKPNLAKLRRSMEQQNSISQQVRWNIITY